MARRLSTLQLAERSCAAARERAVRAIADAAARPIRASSGAAVQGRSWKGAVMNRLSSDWLASLLSPQDELRGPLRVLRARGRELARNNPYAGSFVEQHIPTNVLGPDGIRMRARVRNASGDLDAGANAVIEDAWRRWTEGPVTADGTMSFAEATSLALATCVCDGESFVQRVLGRDFENGIALSMIDPDLVDDNYSVMGSRNTPWVFMGVEVDSFGRRLAYHVLDLPYGPGYRGGPPRRVDASDVRHLFRPKRVNQMRGVTWLSRAMAPLHDLERYQQNELVAAAAGAAKMGFITNENGPVSSVTNDPITEGAAVNPESGAAAGGRVSVEAEPGTIWELEQGQKFESWSPDHPATAFSDFVRSVLRSTAAGLGVSYETLSADLSQVSYLSARAGLLIERAIYQQLQRWWIRVYQQPIFDWWLEASMMSGALQLPGGDWRQYRDVLWIPRGWDWVDPQKDAAAAKLMLDLRLTTRTRLAAARGDDFEKILEETEREEAAATARGIRLEAPATPGSAGSWASVPGDAPKPGAPGADPDAADEGSEVDDSAEEEIAEGAGA